MDVELNGYNTVVGDLPRGLGLNGVVCVRGALCREGFKANADRKSECTVYKIMVKAFCT